MSPKFSIIIPHYQGSIDHGTFLRGVNSILNQTYQDFEILCFHDGPLLSEEEFPVEVICTEKRYDDWGHTLRDIGIQKATGEYILHFNPDNVLSPNALEVLSSYGDDSMVFGIDMVGMEEGPMRGNPNMVRRFYSTPRNESKRVTLSGNPIAYGNIDCMQFVAKRTLWETLGGWKDKRKQSDFYLFSELAQMSKPVFIKEVLGEHY